ncbi:NEW3 domain-containing protein [Kitasatospora mediocidica]|uniref:NEW3 domain-containing protein n=1 Tax=Kitasatospora mediocidica TaxID=58352 RepID=UPI0007C66283|nr:NEW3 domain-containing protein [Kitasatospora mediocidica]
MTSPLARRLRAALAGCCALATASAGLLLASPVSAEAATSPTQYPNYAPTPPMGWNDWSYYQCDISEQTILGNAQALVDSGLAAKGYDTVTTDDCWMGAQRDAAGDLVADPVKFPHGMDYVGARLHAMGLKFGIYEDAGTDTCGGYPGSLNHWQQDANLFAKWGVDYVKLDGCNVPGKPGESDEQSYHDTYAAWSRAMLNTGRPMVFSVSAPAYFQGTDDAVWHSVIGWSAQVGNLWREGADIALGQDSGAGKWGSITYNYGYNVGLADQQSPGRWNDPDFLLAGDAGLSRDETQSQMSLWAMMAAPLISSTDLTRLSADGLAVLGNPDVIAVDQDRAGVQGRIVQQGAGYDVLSKPLANGDRAVALFNSSDSAQTVTTTAAAAGLGSGSSFLLKDLVTKNVTRTTGTISADIPPHATVLYRVSAGGGHTVQPATALSWRDVSTEDRPATYQVSLANLGATGIEDTTLRLTAPAGWTVSPSTVRLNRVAPGATATATVVLTAPKAPPGTTVSTITAAADYQAGPAGRGAVSGPLTITQVVPYPTLAAAFNNVGVTAESTTAPGNLDGGGDSYSADALAKAGATPGAAISANGLSFTWPTAAPGTADNVATAGEAVELGGQGSAVAFLGAETGFASGTVTVTYTDGTTSTGQLGFPNWCCTPTSDYGAQIVLTTDHRNTPAGPANYGTSYRVFSNTVPLTAGKTVRTVTLPDQPAIHLFALSIKP